MLYSTKKHRYHALAAMLMYTCSLWLLFQVSLQASWARDTVEVILSGLVKSRPDSVTGYGAWMIEEEKPGGGTLYTVLVDDHTLVTSAMPDVGDLVEVTGDLQGATTIIATKLHRKNDNSASNKLYGWVKSAPANGIGEWVLRLRQDTTQTVLADSNTRFPHGMPSEGKAVAIRYVLQNGSTYLAKSIRPDDYEEQEIIVRLRTGVTSGTIASRYGLVPLATLLASGNIHLFQTPEAVENNLVAQLNQDADVVWAELNYVSHVPVGNPKRVWNWGGVNPTGYVNQGAFEQVNVGSAQVYYQGQGTTIAIIDTGADLNHEALREHLAPAVDLWDVVADDQLPQDEGPGFAQGHGTHIAGIIARIAPASKLLIVRALDTNGRGSIAKLTYAIEWAVDHGADVINLSLGADSDSRILKLAIAGAMEDGVVIVAAAGNDNTSTRQYPAGYPNVLSVTAVDAANVKADFANYGSSWVKLAAPGVGITSSIIGPLGSGYASWSGTSMATAFVSGAAALLRQQNPSADVSAITARLEAHAHELDSTNPTYAGQLGGLLDVSAALEVQPVATAMPTSSSPTATPVATLTPGAPILPTATTTPEPPNPTATPTPTVTPSPLPTVAGNQGQQYIYLAVVEASK